ncbi:hypothetical protein [Psychrobacter piscatorii]|uniref:hypothetical protein n=1 Tax=Psychrobacter piscatorii TaxID=554343 RepID=UPI0037352532
MLRKDNKGVLYKRVIHNKWKKVEYEDSIDTNLYKSNYSSFIDVNDSFARVLSVVIVGIAVMLIVFGEYLISWKIYDFPYNIALALYNYTLYEPLSSVPAVFKFFALDKNLNTTWLQVVWAIFCTIAYLVAYLVLWFVSYQGLARICDKYGISRLLIFFLYLLPFIILIQGWISDGLH